MKNKFLKGALLASVLLNFYFFFGYITQFPITGYILGNEVTMSEKTLPIVAVSNQGKGAIASVSLKMIPGEGDILVNTNPFTEPNLQFSAAKSVEAVKQYTNYMGNNDFVIDYNADTVLIGGGSAGAATTILAIAAIENRTLSNDVVITGSIMEDGSIGKVSGILAKTYSVGEAGFEHFLVPRGQSNFTYYEKVLDTEPLPNGMVIRDINYVRRIADIKELAEEEWGLKVVEVENIEDAAEYFFEGGL